MIAKSDILTLSNGMKFMRVPAGTFLMGSKEDNKPPFGSHKLQHTVDIPYDYWMARYPVTNKLYSIYVKSIRSRHPVNDWAKKKEHPVIWIAWNDAVAYCQWLNNLVKDELPQNLILRLPTEAEWENAARGTDGREYPWGNTFDKNKCNTREGQTASGHAFFGETTPVGTYSPQGDSPYGCADMAGNVREWTHSLNRAYPYNVNDGREDEKDSGVRILRGGSFNEGGENFAFCANRIDDCDLRFSGFRVVLSVALT